VREDAVIYLDDVRLIPSPVGATGVATATAQGPFDYGFSKRKPFWTVVDPELGGEVVRIPFIVKNETQGFCKLCPVEGGIPLPMGEVRESSRIRLRNAQGEDLPFQTRVLTRWPDGSLKWLGLHFQGTLAPGDGVGFFLEYGPTVQTIDFEGRLSVVEDASLIKINTGALEASFEKDKFYLFERVVLDLNSDGVFEPSEEMLKEASLTLQFRGKEFRTDLAKKDYKIEVEEKGTQRVVVKASGWFQSEDGQRYCQAIVRYYFYQGKSYVKVSHTLIYTGYPENKQFDEYKNLKLPENETIDSFGLKLPYPFSENKEEMVVAGQDQAIPTGVQLSDRVRLLQMDWDRGTLTRDSILVPSKSFYAGWLDVSNRSKGITLAIRNFRENFPKAFEADRSKGEIRVDLWPKDAGELDLSTTEKAVGPDDYGRGNAFGLAKTHDLLFYFHGPVKGEIPNPGDIAASFMKSMIIRPNPYWIDATGALGRLHPVEQRYATEEKMLERLFDWATRHPRMFRWYGMLNFGDTLTWWREKDEERGYGTFGWHPVGRWGWYNCEGVGLHTGALLQFARSGEWRYFEFGESAARHIMDVDTVHYNTIENDKRLRRILKDKYSKVGAMHRHSADHWSGRTDEASHTNVVGILLYYFLTGDERALDVAKEIGEYFLSEPFTYIGYPHVAPNRAMANALWGDVLLYQVTGDERYKEAADKIVKIFLKGQQQDGSFLENYNPIFHIWSGEKHELYMAGYLVGALISYHELTQDEEVKEMFLRLVRYLAPLPYSGPTILHGLAYAYLTTHDPFFIEVSERNLKGLLDHQQFSQDPIMDGLIYEKPIYHRPMAFLSTVPYVFGAFDEEMLKKGSQG
ncbi:MAG: glycoside hydrolase family 127 protein, partial [Candidatus Omnitrophica bacterium]|nr:glycoside hydrolase family 127 protein [Candidatus Omnitrophota bacterium]